MASLLKGVGYITGAAAGIGKATAQSFAKYGVRRLALGDLNIKALKETANELKTAYPGLEVLPLELNTASEDSVNNSISTTIKQFGRIDYAVNNAGIAGAAWKSAESDLAGWQKTLDVNLTGVWLCSRAEIREMLKQEPLEPGLRSNRGVIVNVASMYGIIGTNASVGNVSYSATKHGVVGMTKADAIVYAKEGIRINAMCPGYVATPLLKSAGPELMAGEVARTPLDRLAEMEEIGDSIVYMVSPLSSFMHGSSMVVDGGYSIQ